MRSTRLRLGLIGLIAVGIGLGLASNSQASIQSQRSQRAVYILVNVTPAPLAYHAAGDADAAPGISARMEVRGRGSAMNVDAFHPVDGSVLVAQSTPQKAVKVEASVTPDPNATLLYTDNQTVIINAQAGTTVTQPCAFHVNVHTTIAQWTLRHGLSNDFASSFSGTNLQNKTYSITATPEPAATAFAVFPDNGTWFVLATSGGIQTYCVDLVLTVPSSVPGGAYSTNAVYTLYY